LLTFKPGNGPAYNLYNYHVEASSVFQCGRKL